ncbi:MAG TPA: hypothetical protein VFS43_24725 [Polyangiaceae bacterium]|nr:hypothetical protein [Polyangiaceae bacterium]
MPSSTSGHEAPAPSGSGTRADGPWNERPAAFRAAVRRARGHAAAKRYDGRVGSWPGNCTGGLSSSIKVAGSVLYQVEEVYRSSLSEAARRERSWPTTCFEGVSTAAHRLWDLDTGRLLAEVQTVAGDGVDVRFADGALTVRGGGCDQTLAAGDGR